jgi:hypothetical protein
MRFQVLTAASMKMDVFWVVVLRMEAGSTSETSVNFYNTTRHKNPEDSRLHIPCFTPIHTDYPDLTIAKAGP